MWLRVCVSLCLCIYYAHFLLYAYARVCVCVCVYVSICIRRATINKKQNEQKRLVSFLNAEILTNNFCVRCAVLFQYLYTHTYIRMYILYLVFKIKCKKHSDKKVNTLPRIQQAVSLCVWLEHTCLACMSVCVRECEYECECALSARP